MKKHGRIALVTAMSFTAPAAGADTLWDNGEPDGSNGYSNGTAELFGGRRSLLDNFTVPEGEVWAISSLRTLHIWDESPCGSGTGFEVRIRYGSARSTAVQTHRYDTPSDLIATLKVTSYEESATGHTWFNRAECESFIAFEEYLLPPGRYWFEANIVGGNDNDFWLVKDRRDEPAWSYYEKFGGLERPFEPFWDLAWVLSGRVLPPGPGDGPAVDAIEVDDVVAAIDGVARGVLDLDRLLDILAVWGGCSP